MPTATALGFITHLVDPSEVSHTVTTIASSGKPDDKYPEAHQTRATRYRSCPRRSIPTPTWTRSSPGGPRGIRPGGQERRKTAKVAVQGRPGGRQDRGDLLDKALSTDLAAGLQLELDALDDIFATQDAREGLSALIEGRRPEYVGS